MNKEAGRAPLEWIKHQINSLFSLLEKEAVIINERKRLEQLKSRYCQIQNSSSQSTGRWRGRIVFRRVMHQSLLRELRQFAKELSV